MARERGGLLCVVLAVLCPLVTYETGRAQEGVRADEAAAARTPSATAAGVFMRHTDSPTTQTHRAAFNSQAGYDGSRRSGTVELRAELTVLGGPRSAARVVGLSLIGGASYLSPAAHAAPIGGDGLHAFGGVKLQPLFQARHGVDGAFSVSYLSHGFNLAPALATGVLLGRRLADTQLLLNLDYAQSFAHGDRFGRLRAASLTRVVRELRVGMEGRASFDLGFEDDTPGEAAYDIGCGPFASYALNHLVLSLGLGPTLLRFTDKPGNGTQRDRTLVGVALNVGLGTTL
jgi:hypothetical protein